MKCKYLFQIRLFRHYRRLDRLQSADGKLLVKRREETWACRCCIELIITKRAVLKMRSVCGFSVSPFLLVPFSSLLPSLFFILFSFALFFPSFPFSLLFVFCPFLPLCVFLSLSVRISFIYLFIYPSFFLSLVFLLYISSPHPSLILLQINTPMIEVI